MRPEGSNDARLPPTEYWFVGRRWFGVLAAVVAAANAVLVALDLSTGDVDTAGAWAFAIARILLCALFTVQSLQELRERILVDEDGVHHRQAVQTHTYRWKEIEEVRPGRALWGDPWVELVRHDGEAVALPKSADRLDALQRWHTAMSGRSEG